MLSRFASSYLHKGKRLIAFSHRLRWPLKESKYSQTITADLYRQQQDATLWTTVDSPKLVATKHPHLEIFLTRTLQDIGNRYQLMSGRRVKALYGVNCYGGHIPEIVYGSLHEAVERPPLEVRGKCREYVKEAVENYNEAWRKWGLLCEENYLTMDKEYEGTVAEAFARLWEKSKKPFHHRTHF